MLIIGILFLCVNVASALEVTFLFWSDKFSHNIPSSEMVDGKVISFGGVGTLSGMIETLRQENPNSFVLVAGGELGGTAASAFTRGLSQVEILNRLKIDAMVPGEYEFEYGWRNLQEIMSKASFPVLLANILIKKERFPIFPPDTVIETADSKVGIIGLLNPEFGDIVMRESVLELEGFNPVSDVIDFVKRCRENCDLLVALSYMGWEADSILATGINGLDVIISGKGGEPLESPRVINDILLVRARPYGRWLGMLNITVDTENGGVFEYESTVLPVKSGSAPLDRKLEDMAQKVERKYADELNRKLSKLQYDWEIYADRPSNLAQWTADMMLETAPVSLSVINNNSLKKGLPEGIITEHDMWEICPHEYPLVVFQITGREMIDILKRQVKGMDEFITWGGLTLAAENGELKDVFIAGKPLNWREDYAVVTTGELWGNLEYYLNIWREGRPRFYLPEYNLRDKMIEAVERERIISSELDERWIVR